MDTPEPTRENYDRLIAYLPILYGERVRPLYVWVGHGVQADGTIRLGWPDYDQDVESFFREISQPVWIDFQYNRKNPIELLSDPSAVKQAGLPEMRAMLTYCLRGERFSDGFWGAMIEEGRIRQLLERLVELRDEIYSEPPQAAS